MTSTVESTSDARVVNNLMRHEYRVLSEEEKLQMKAVKDMGLAFVAILHSIGGTIASAPDAEARQSSRELALAQTAIEEAVMWAVKHITR